MMRFASVFASFAAALICVLLIFGCVRENTAIDTMEAKFDSLEQQAQTYRDQTGDLQKQLDELRLQTEQARTRLSILQSRENYKTEPTIFLTFDEAFSRNTIDIIALLDERQIKGTFFVIGETLGNESMRAALKSAAEAGHRIGIRSDVIKFSPIYKSEEAYFADLYACRDRIREITGEAPVLIRMPGGTATAEYYFKRNTGSSDVFQAVMKRLQDEGFILDDWNVDSTDATSSNVSTVVNTTLNGAKRYLTAEYKTCIILFTDNGRAVRALPDVIDGLKQQGFSFSVLPTSFSISKQR